jgi:hypothetical protein
MVIFGFCMVCYIRFDVSRVSLRPIRVGFGGEVRSVTDIYIYIYIDIYIYIYIDKHTDN